MHELKLMDVQKKYKDKEAVRKFNYTFTNGELIQEGTEKEITDKVEGCVWKCIVSEKEAGQITSSFIVSNMGKWCTSNGEVFSGGNRVGKSL